MGSSDPLPTSSPPSPGPFYFLLAVLMAVLMLLVSKAFAGEVRTVRLSDDKVAMIPVSARGTALSFPVKPTHVVLGKKGSFGIEYVENDLTLTPLGASVRSHLFVYLYGRRFSFDLVSGGESGAAVVLVRDLADTPQNASLKKVQRLNATPSKLGRTNDKGG